MRNDKRRKPLDHTALYFRDVLLKRTPKGRRRYRVVLVFDPEKDEQRIINAFGRWLRRILEQYRETWTEQREVKEANDQIVREVDRLRRTRRGYNRTAPAIAKQVGATVSRVERIITSLGKAAFTTDSPRKPRPPMTFAEWKAERARNLAR